MLIKTTPAKMNEVLPYGSTSAENCPQKVDFETWKIHKKNIKKFQKKSCNF